MYWGLTVLDIALVSIITYFLAFLITGITIIYHLPSDCQIEYQANYSFYSTNAIFILSFLTVPVLIRHQYSMILLLSMAGMSVLMYGVSVIIAPLVYKTHHCVAPFAILYMVEIFLPLLLIIIVILITEINKCIYGSRPQAYFTFETNGVSAYEAIDEI